jgi:iron complex outermembrane receptor protein
LSVDVDRSRIKVHPTKKFLNFSNVIGVSVQKNESQKTTFNLAYVMRNPNVNELFSEGLHHSSAQIERGDLRLKSEKSLKLNLDFQKIWKNSNNFQTNFEVFFNYINDFIYGEPTDFETTIRGSFPVMEYKQVDALLCGIASDISWDFHQNFTLFNKFSYQIGQNQTQNIPLFIVAPWQTTTSLQWKPKFTKDFYAELQHQFVAQQNRFPNYNQEISYFQGNQQITKIVDISSSPNNYHLFNAEFGKKIQWKHQKLTLGLFIENALNTSYRNYLNRLRFFADEAGRNFKFQIKYQF